MQYMLVSLFLIVLSVHIWHPDLTKSSWTGRYVAPEVFRNEEYDTKVDVFSFALILQEVTTLCAPIFFFLFKNECEANMSRKTFILVLHVFLFLIDHVYIGYSCRFWATCIYIIILFEITCWNCSSKLDSYVFAWINVKEVDLL